MKAPPLLLVLFVCAGLCPAHAAKRPSPFTPKELAQGYREHVLAAKPRAAWRASVDREEAREHLHIREKFARLGDLRVIELGPTDDMEGTLRRLRASGRYEFVEPDYIMSPDATPNDPQLPLQWALDNTGQQFTGAVAGADIHALAAWNIVHDAPDVIIAVLDGGARIDHAELQPNLWTNPAPTLGDVHGISILDGVRSANIDDEDGHGTHVAGIIAAAGNNDLAIAGVVWRAQLMILKDAAAGGASSSLDSAACVDYAVAHGAKIINCSFGGVGYSHAFFTALRAARDAGVIVVCSAGNSGLSNDLAPHYPSNYLLDNIVAVGNSTPDDHPSSSSDYGNAVELFAPGTSILSLDYKGTSGTVRYSGTSMAAPHVAGALALLKARFPGDTYRQLINRLLRGAEYESPLAGRSQTNGRLNLLDALNTTTNRPFNDDFRERAFSTGTTIALRTNNAGATLEGAAEPPHTGGAQASLWWQWIAPVSGKAVIVTSGSDYDTVLEVYTGPDVALSATELTPLVVNDDEAGGRTSRVSFPVTALTSYFICISGKNSETGYTQLNLGVAPANDDFANAIALSSDSTHATGQNNSATREPGEPQILGYAGGVSLWYKWNAPRTGRYQISSFSLDFDTLLAVYTGSAVNALTLVGADADTNAGPGIANTDSRVTLNAVAGTTYYIQVDSKTSTPGEVVVSLTDSLWQFSDDGGEITSSPAIAPDGTLYVGAATPDDRLYAIASDGTLEWSYAMGGGVDVNSAAIAPDGTIYQGAFGGRFVALNPDGTLKWSRELGTDSDFAGSPAIGGDGTIYTHTRDGYVYALSPTDGTSKWRFNAHVYSYASAVIAADGTIYQGSDGDRALYALNPDGTLKWRYDAPGDTFSTPALDAAGNVYFATYSTPRVISLTPAGTPRWTYTGVSGSNSLSGSPVLSGDGNTVYVGASDRKLHALDAASGAARWTFTLDNAVLASTPAVDRDGTIYVGCYDGKLYAINSAGTLKRTWDTAEPIRSSPAIFGTTLYVGSNDGKLYAFDIGASSAGGPWPQYRQNARLTGRGAADALAITAQPAAQIVPDGQPVTLRVAATGQGPLSFQWQKNGNAIAGATGSTLTLASAGGDNAGSYTVTVTGLQGSVTSAAAAVGVATEIARIINLSILTTLDSPDDTFTMGYVVGGAGTSGSKTLLIRAAGPALGTLNIGGYLEDPKFELYTNATKTGENDDWGGSATLADAMSAVGAFAYAGPATKDAAMLTDVAAPQNSVKVSGRGSGLVIAEIYDATPSHSITLATPRLVNVSFLKNIAGGLTAGFVVTGKMPITVLIRAIGPTLGQPPFNVGGAAADPQLTLFDNHSTPIASNDDWGGTTKLEDAFHDVGAFELDARSKDAALVTTLPPGVYTVGVNGVNDSTGIALVEVYEVP